MSIEIKIGAKFYGADGIKQAQRELEKLARAADTYSQSIVAKMARTGESFSRLGQTLTTNLSLPLMAIGGLSIKAFTEQEDAIAKMEAVIKSTGGVAGVTSSHITDLSSSLQETTTFADEVTTNAAALLLTFKGVRNEMGEGNDVFDRTIRASQDLSALMGKDLNESVMMLGKALQDPETGLTKLTRAGVQFSDQQKDQIKTLAESGDILGAQKIMLAEIESQFGGTAEAMAQTAGGKLKQAFNDLGEAGEAIGAEIAPILADVAGFVADIIKKFTELPGPIKTAVTLVGGIVAALGPAIWGTGVMLTNLATIGKTKLGTAVIDGFSAIRTAISNAAASAGGFANLLKSRTALAIGGFTAAAVGAGIILNHLANEQARNAEERFKTLGVGIDASAEALKNFDETGRLGGVLEDLPTVLQDIQTETEGMYNWFVRPRIGGDGGALGFISGLFTSVDDNAEKARNTVARWDQALKDVELGEAIRQYEKLRTEAQNLGYSLPLDLFPELKSRIENAGTAANVSADQVVEMALAGDDLTDSMSAAEQALKDWADTVKAQFEPAFAYQDAVYDQADAVLALEEAQKKQKEVLASFPADSAEARDALRQLNEAERNLIITTGELNARQNGLLEGLKNGEISAKDAIDTIRSLGDQHGLTAEQIQGQIDNFNALAALVLMTEFPSVVIPVNSNAAEVLEKLLAIKAAVDALKAGASATVNVIGNVVRGFATGGPVTAGMPHMVGERGRELFIPSTDGVIVPHHQSRRILSESAPATTGPQTTNNVVNVTVNKTEASPYEIGRELLWAMKVAG
jgi:hypothetical protein